MRIFIDTEFIEDGKTIDLLSIGLVKENGECYYAVNKEADLTKACEWVKGNVIPNLFINDFTEVNYSKSREQIKNDILEFCNGVTEFWGYYSDYDWVVFCQLFGKMIDLPDGWPMFCLDVKQIMHALGINKEDILKSKDVSKSYIEHNALEDAVEIKTMYENIREYEKNRDYPRRK